jgi:hypothetical protein
LNLTTTVATVAQPNMLSDWMTQHKVVAKRVAFVRELDVLSVLEDGRVGQIGHTEFDYAVR